MSPRVMVIIAADHVSGPAKGLFQLFLSIGKSKVKYFLYNFKYNQQCPDSFINEATDLGIKVSLFDQKKKSYISLISQVLREVRLHEISIVQTHGFKPSVLGFFSQFFCKVKWICFLHGTTSENFKVKLYYLLENFIQVTRSSGLQQIVSGCGSFQS